MGGAARGGARGGGRARSARARGARRAGDRGARARVRLRPARPRREPAARSAQTESHRLIEHLMIAANERVATLLDEREVPTLYRVHERPEPEARRAPGRRSSRRSASPTPPVPEHDVAVAGGRRSSPSARVLVDQHVRRTRPRPPRAHVARAALAQAGALLAAEPRPRRPAARRTTATSPRRSAATPTSSATARCSARSAAGEDAPRGDALDEAGEWTSARASATR